MLGKIKITVKTLRVLRPPRYQFLGTIHRLLAFRFSLVSLTSDPILVLKILFPEPKGVTNKNGTACDP